MLPSNLTQTENKANVPEQSNNTNKDNLGSVKINYKLNHIPKIASNQIAVWIEDLDGKYIRTIYATNFTANGGYTKREEALPTWIEKSNRKNTTKSEIDAVSSATQSPGNIALKWDCKDKDGRPVKPGKYVYVIEGNIYWSNRVMWRGEIEVGKEENKSLPEVKYEPEAAKNEGVLIENVSAVFTPEK